MPVGFSVGLSVGLDVCLTDSMYVSVFVYPSGTGLAGCRSV